MPKSSLTSFFLLCLLGKKNERKSSLRLFQNIGKVIAKRYSTDLRAVNAVQLSAVIKGNFSGLLFYSMYHSEGKFPRDYVRNVATGIPLK